MIKIEPLTLELHGVRLERMTASHVEDLVCAAQDGELWKLCVTSGLVNHASQHA